MKWTAEKIKNLKGLEKWSMVTAYDAISASWAESASISSILVGDSLGMTALGYENTLPVTMEEMLHHSAAVSRVVKNALIIADMPFMSYQASVEQGIENAGRFIKDSNTDAVKVEGGIFRVNLIHSLVQNGIPVLGHIGLTPQSIKEIGGYKVQGKNPSEYQSIIDDAKAVEEAGAFAVVLECIPSELSLKITDSLSIPTVGIGAGSFCDAQVLVISDLLGLSNKVCPKFVKKYINLFPSIQNAIQQFKIDVESGRFPSDEHNY
mgnify:CR=1 FL=1